MSNPGKLAELNDHQAAAAAHVAGPILVFAGAGSGKTRVITYRIANLIACARVPPYRILAVTFTNKAAGEMRERLKGILGEDVARDTWVGTFHATCAKLLRIHGGALGIGKNFVIYDSGDQKSVVTRVLRELELDEKRYPPKGVLQRIHKEKQEGRSPENMARNSYMDDAIRKVYERYEAMLRAANAVDFEDLIWLTVRLLEENPEGEGDRMRRRFESVLVDEFQDTNAIQYRLLRGFAKDHRNLCVVGDDDQSIYRWRGADVRNIRGFQSDFPDATVVKLEQNYRSSGNIVRAALGIIARSSQREPKELWTENPEGELVDVVATAEERDEAAHVIRVIQESRAAGVDPSEIAVFYRVHAQSRVLEEALRSVNIPYQIVGGTKFYERAEIKDALSYLRILVNPKSDVDVLRIINTPPRGIGATTVERLLALATAQGVSVLEALSLVDSSADLAGAAKKKLGGLRELLARLAEDAGVALPSALLKKILDETGYTAGLRQENSPESDSRLENLQEFYGSLKEFEVEMESAGEMPTVEAYLERISLQADIDSVKGDSRVTLMTVHGAKGLEFRVVVLTGMEEEMFPYRGMTPGGDEELEEERRLAYVAVTRAREKLVITHTGTRQIFGMTRWGRPSRFLADVPSHLVSALTTRAAGARSQSYTSRGGDDDYGSPRGSSWEHPQRTYGLGRESSAPPPKPAPGAMPGERVVDRSYFEDDAGSGGGDTPLQRGSVVKHKRFGEGKVLSVEGGATPSVVAFFPGWGEKKILLAYLMPA